MIQVTYSPHIYSLSATLQQSHLLVLEVQDLTGKNNLSEDISSSNEYSVIGLRLLKTP